MQRRHTGDEQIHVATNVGPRHQPCNDVACNVAIAINVATMGKQYDHYRTHRRSRRLAGYDYTSTGWYFVTICTKDRLHLFGEIREGIMGLNDVGCVAHECWESIALHVKGAYLDAFIVMPNHVHGLIGLLREEDDANPATSGHTTSGHATSGKQPNDDQAPNDTRMSAISPPAGSLSAVIRSYKSAVTREIRQRGASFGWQPRFHDHVVRDGRALGGIRAYILNNPATWAEDVFKS